MFFHLKLAKNYQIISQFYYKQKNKTFNIDTNSLGKVNKVNNRVGSFTIKLLYLFGLNQLL